jgi:hypothetical protein
MQTMQRRRQHAGLPPHGANPGGAGSQYRSTAAAVADAADRAMADALANTEAVKRSLPQQSGQ